MEKSDTKAKELLKKIFLEVSALDIKKSDEFEKLLLEIRTFIVEGEKHVTG